MVARMEPVVPKAEEVPSEPEPRPLGEPGGQATTKDLFAGESAATGQDTRAPEGPAPPRVKKENRNLPWLVVLLALVVAGAGLVAYFLFLRDDVRSDQTTTTVSAPTTTVDSTTPAMAEALGGWTELTPAGAVPTARSGHALAYAPGTSRAILFGGSHLDTKLGDTWAFDPTTDAWTELHPGAVAPSARSYPEMVYDSASSQMILFGGDDASGSRNDTWTFDPATVAWTELSPTGIAPPSRFGHAMVYDPGSRQVLLFGGVNSSTTGLLNDLWAYDPTDNTWTRLEPSGTPPVKRMWHSFVYDPGSQLVILFGGYGGASGSTGANLDDLWAYDPAANSWAELDRMGERPLARQGHAMVLDSGSGDLLLYGGCDGLTGLGDVWRYDPAVNSWTQLEPKGDAPAGRDSHAMTYDGATQATILFGGYSFTGNFDFNDTWTYGAEPGGEGP